MRLAAALVLLVAAPAHADPETEVDLDLRPDDAAAFADAGFSTGATALTEDDTAGVADATVSMGAHLEGGAEWRYRNSSSYVRGQADAGVYVASDGAGLTFAQDAEVRPYALEFLQFTFADRLAFDAAPKLGDRPDRWRRRYRTAGFDVDLVGAQFIGKHVGAQFMRVDNGFAWEEQQDGADTVKRFVSTADWSPFAFTLRRDGEEVGRLDPIVLEAIAIDGAYDGVVMTELWPRLTNLEVGPVSIDAAYGRASTGWQQISVDDEVVSTITSAELPVIRTPAWRARLGLHGKVEASAGIERNLHLTADAALVLEERASAEVRTTFGDTEVSATGFAARSKAWTSPDDSQRYVTGGGGVSIATPVRDLWTLTGNAEVARSFYASLQGERGLHVDTAVKLDLGLRREIRNWLPRGKR